MPCVRRGDKTGFEKWVYFRKCSIADMEINPCLNGLSLKIVDFISGVFLVIGIIFVILIAMIIF